MSKISKQHEVSCGVKKCDAENCPCCGGFTEKYASPQAVVARDSDGNLERAILFWRCGACGCEWRHGQFNKKEATVPFASIRAGSAMTIDGRAFVVVQVTEPTINPLGRFEITVERQREY